MSIFDKLAAAAIYHYEMHLNNKIKFPHYTYEVAGPVIYVRITKEKRNQALPVRAFEVEELKKCEELITELKMKALNIEHLVVG